MSGPDSLSLASLSRPDALLALAVRRFVTDELGVDWQRKGLLIALSGGVDSTALLVLLCALRPVMGLRLTAAHLDHALRPESAEDAAACGQLCARFDIPLLVERVDVAAEVRPGEGLEEAGRRIRYAFLAACREQTGSDWIVTGHHADDLAEDILLRLVRGASWPGLGGMRGADAERRVLRPLLMTDKARLVALLRRRGISWREDSSNAGDAFRRNRIRHGVLPLLRAENPSFNGVARQLWRTARADEAFWSESLRELPVPVEEGAWLPAEVLQSMPTALRRRAFVAALRSLGVFQTSSATLLRLEQAWKEGRREGRFQFGTGVTAHVSPRGIVFRMPGNDR